MVPSAQKLGAIVEAVGGLVVFAVGAALFLPRFHAGIGHPLVLSASGLAVLGSALESVDESRRTTGSALLLLGSLGALAGTAIALLDAPGALERVLAVAAATVAVVAASVDALDARGWSRDPNAQFVQLGATSGLVGAVLLSNLPPAGDEPFRTLFVVFAAGAAGYGAVVLGLALWDPRSITVR